MLAVKLGGKDLVMRELMPQDLKFDLDRLTQEQAVAAARYLAGVVGKAHGRQMDTKTRSSWLSQVKKTAFQKPRCTKLALVKCGRAHRGS